MDFIHFIDLSISPVLWHKCQIVFSSCCALTHARHAGRFDCLMTSLILMTMDCGSPETQGSQINPHRGIENWKMHAIKQVKICAECWDMVPKASAGHWEPCPSIQHRSWIPSWRNYRIIGGAWINVYTCLQWNFISEGGYYSNTETHSLARHVQSPWIEYIVYSKKYAHGLVVLCFVVVMQSFIMNSHKVFIHIHQGCFAGTGAIVRLPQCQWSKPDGYGKISQCITTTKHSKAKTVCIFLGIYCIST